MAHSITGKQRGTILLRLAAPR